MKIIKQGAECQPIQEMDELTFVCSCGCEYKANIKHGEAQLEARLSSISPYPVFSSMPILYVYSSVCPCCGSICLYQGEPINYCCCQSDEETINELKEKLEKAGPACVPDYISGNPLKDIDIGTPDPDSPFPYRECSH